MKCFNKECDFFDEADPLGDNCHIIQDPEPSDCEAIVSHQAVEDASPVKRPGSTAADSQCKDCRFAWHLLAGESNDQKGWCYMFENKVEDCSKHAIGR